MKRNSNTKLNVILDQAPDLPDLCKIANRSRHSGLELLFLLIFLLSLFSPSFSQSTIKIGFLIRDNNDHAIKEAAELAINHANSEVDYKGQKFELVTQSCDGPWGMTSKKAVALIYEHQVPILVTALDGQNAHLAEQVAAKSHVAMLSTLSSDPTLSRAYVPWYCRMVPDDKQQASALVRKIYANNKSVKVLVVALDGYDGKQSAQYFYNIAQQGNYELPEILLDLKVDQIIRKLENEYWEAIVLAGNAQEMQDLYLTISDKNVYAFLNYFNFSQSTQQTSNIKTLFYPPVDYVYDGILIATEAVKRFGNDAEAIREGFKSMKLKGKTGLIEFDNLGNRKNDK